MTQIMTAHAASCELLHAEHDVRHNRNNQGAFLLRAQLARDPAQAEQNRHTAAFYGQRWEAAKARVVELQSVISQSAKAFA